MSVRHVLDLDPNRAPATPRKAATIVLLRDPPAGGEEVEVCVMQRSQQSTFVGGAVVFPGGRVEEADEDDAWDSLTTRVEGAFPEGARESAWWDRDGRAARIAACREALEEVGIVPVEGALTPDAQRELREAAAAGATSLREALARTGLRLDLASLIPFARWLTPEAEKRRYDTRFFLARAPRDQEPASDDREAVKVFWSSPSALLRDFEAGTVALVPPTHRTLELLVGHRDVDDALGVVSRATLEVICPRFLVRDDTPTLALPGDPSHEIREARIAGKSRYVLRDARWVPEGDDTFGP